MKKFVVAFSVMIVVSIFCFLAACSTGRNSEAPSETGGPADLPQAVPVRQVPPSGSIPWASASARFARWQDSAWATYCLAVGPDGAVAASGDYAEVLVFSVDGKLVKRFPVQDHATPWGLSFSADGKLLALATPYAPSRIMDAGPAPGPDMEGPATLAVAGPRPIRRAGA